MLNDILDLYSRFDLTYLTPRQNLKGTICYVTPVLNDILDLCRCDLTYLTPTHPPQKNFMGAFCHVTPVLNDILDLCRFDLTYLTPIPPQPKFLGCISSCYTQ